MKSGFNKVRKLFSLFIDYCVGRATASLKDDKCTEASANIVVDWLYVAASLAWCMNPGYLRSIKIEQILSKISLCTLGVVKLDGSEKKAGFIHVFHVATSVSNRGGHTRVISRWIDTCMMFAKDQVHHLVLTGQGTSDIPEWLANAISKTGGKCILVGEKSGWIGRSAHLRDLVTRHADVIVLHVHPNDPIVNLALFGMKVHMPIFMFNHADHVFSLGMGVCNRVLDFRKSGQDLTTRYRGVSSTIVPLPMVVDDIAGNNRQKLRYDARKRLDIDIDAVIALTIGDEYKYKDALGYSFIECVRRMLKSEPGLTLIAVGIPNKNEWAVLASETQNRFVPTGNILNKSILNDYYRAADIYLEGFPFSSLTAMIDAGLNGLPMQRMRNVKLPILSGDDVALDGLIGAATNCEEYVSGVSRLIEMGADMRERLGVEISESIKSCHCGEMWLKEYITPLFNSSVANLDSLCNGPPEKMNIVTEGKVKEDCVLDSLACFQWETKGAFSVVLLSMARSPLSLSRLVCMELSFIFKNMRILTPVSVIFVLLSPFFLMCVRYAIKWILVISRARRKS